MGYENLKEVGAPVVISVSFLKDAAPGAPTTFKYWNIPLTFIGKLQQKCSIKFIMLAPKKNPKTPPRSL